MKSQLQRGLSEAKFEDLFYLGSPQELYELYLIK
jgi:hypothetical protein